MSKLVRNLRGIVIMPEFEDSKSAAMWNHRFNPIMMIWCALTR